MNFGDAEMKKLVSRGRQKTKNISAREQLIRLASRVARVLAHYYRLGSPVGTREVALRRIELDIQQIISSCIRGKEIKSFEGVVHYTVSIGADAMHHELCNLLNP